MGMEVSFFLQGTGGCLFLQYALSIQGIARSRKTG
jgi:hypothetical protein